MKENPDSSDWAAERGDKWRAHLSFLEPMLHPVDEPLIRALTLESPLRIADIGCGGGATSLEVLSRAPAGSVVHGYDVAPGLVEYARGRAHAQAGKEDRSIAFHLADVSTAVPEAPYDRLVSRFGIMFFGDAPGAFKNLFRWLVPGGRFAFAAWGPPSANAWIRSIRDAVAEVVEVPPPDLEAPGPFRYADEKKLLSLLAAAGFGKLEVRDFSGRLPLGSGRAPAEVAQLSLAAFSGFSDLLEKAGDEVTATARRALAARYDQHLQDGVVQLAACVHIFTGERPA